MPDSLGYPTKKELKRIKDWPVVMDIEGFLKFIEDLWHYPDRFVLTGKRIKKLYLSTGGWSGNESIIRAMQENIFWMIAWQKSVRGGHHWFRWKGPK